jgi:hypothetical protein
MSNESNTLQTSMAAQNVPVDSGHFDIEINVLDEDGQPIKKLSEFGSTIVSWSFEPAPPPYGLGSDDDLHFDEPKSMGPETDAFGVVTAPTLDFNEEEEEEEDDEGDEDSDTDEEDEEDDAETVDDYRELVLTHQITGAAFHEVNKYVFGQKRRPHVSVKIEYYVTVDKTQPGWKGTEAIIDEKHPIFTHTFYGVFYVPEDMSGNRAIGGQKQGPLLLVTKMEVLGSHCYGDPTETDTLARIMQEYGNHEEH